MALTETEIKALKAPGFKNDGDGLYLRILPSGRKSWVWRTKRRGQTSYATIGEWPDMGVKKARAELGKRTRRATPPNALTVKDALGEWLRDVIEPRYRVTKNVRTYVERATAEFGRRRLQELTRAEIARFVRSYAKQAPVAANRCLTNIKLALGWCVEVGYLDASPAEGLTKRVAGGEEKSRARVLSDDELRTIWRLDSPNAALLRGLALTGCRIAELQRATPEHISDDWLLIPAEHSKNRRAHRVYVTPELREQFNGTTRLFRAVTATGVQAWVRRLQFNVDGDKAPREPWAGMRPIDRETGKPMPPWTPHDLRRTFATRLGELGVAPHIVEKLLNHTFEGSSVAAIYNRSELLDERSAATKLWTSELLRLTSNAKL